MGGSNHDVNITINTLSKTVGTKDAKASMRLLGDEFKRATGLSLGYAGAITTTIAVTQRLIAYTDAAQKKYDAYVSSIVAGSRITRASLEETSRLFQVADDYFVKSEDLEKSLIIARKNNIDVSIEGLQRLSDQYIASGNDTKFLTDTFGKNGAEMAKLMELSGAKIRAEMDAVSESLVVNAKKVAITFAYKRSLDALNDSQDAFAYNIAIGTMPAITALNSTMATFIEIINDSGVVVNSLNWIITKATGAIMFWGDVFSGEISKIPGIRQELLDLQNQYTTLTEEQMAAAQEQMDLNTQLGNLKIIMAGGIGKEIDSYKEKLKELIDKGYEYSGRIAELNALKYLTPEQKEELEELKANLDKNKEAAKTLALEHEKAMKKMAMDMIIAKVSSDGLTTNEVTNIGKIMVAWGLWDQKTAEVVDSVNGINLDQADAELSGVLGTLEGIMNLPREVKFTVETEYVEKRYTNYVTGTGPNSAATSGVAQRELMLDKDLNGNGIVGAYTGGLVKVGEKGPEIVQLPNNSYVYNNSQTQQMLGGNQVTNYITISGAGDARSVAREVMREIKLQMGGH